VKLAAAVALTAISLAAATSSAGVGKAAPVCGTKAGTPVRISHVIWIWFENHSAGEIVGSSEAPRMTAVARSCGFAANYFAVAHPSLPNYIAATSGGTQGISDDDSPSAHPLPVVSLFEQARSARSYEESMPSPCAASSPYPYAVKHNPEAYYLRVRKACQTDDIALGTTAKGPFVRALDAGTLPAFSFVTPNLCNDMHDCSVATGDAWFGRWMTRITASPTYRAGHTAVFVVWDEDDDTADNRVPLIVVSPWTKAGTHSEARFTHYSLLRTTEELLGIRAHLGHAATAATLGPAFGL
jgi:phosphatidylinositol-3-phosphatase